MHKQSCTMHSSKPAVQACRNLPCEHAPGRPHLTVAAAPAPTPPPARVTAQHSSPSGRTRCSRAAALMRAIQSVRHSLFFSLRPTYACCSAFSTRDRAILMQFFARPRKPLAS
eukprot:365027-Chlamydomonas_euryale.AAC.6